MNSIILWEYLQIAGDFNITNGSEGREVPVGSQRNFRENSVLQDLVSEEHVGELSLYLLGHHLHSPWVRHAPYRRANFGLQGRQAYGPC
jgi:hypothetical protein